MKSGREYEEAFEDLMEYSKFQNINEIQTKEDLRSFFKSVQEDANARGRRFPLSKKLVFKFAQALGRLRTRAVPTRVETRRAGVVRGRPFSGIEFARKAGLTFTFEGKEIFKSKVVIKKRPRTVFRDSKGRFAVSPSTAGLFEDAGGKSLRQDRKKTAKRIVKDTGSYIKEGASNVDLKDFDTKRRQKK